MSRSLLARLLVLALVSAALAASGTVWLTTGDRAGALDVDNEIRAELYRYAREHQDWAGVAPLVHELAGRTGRRIALTGPNGEPIVDSAHGATELPRAPATVIDAAVPAGSTDRPPAGDAGFAYRGWRLSGTESRRRAALADAAAECLRDQAAQPRQLYLGLFGGDTADRALPCVPSELRAPGAMNRSLNDDAVRATAACLDRRGLAYQVSVDDRGLSWVRPDGPRSPEWTDCERDARTAALRDYVAPAAALYLGSGGPGEWRTAAAIAVLLLVLAFGAVLVHRPLAAADRRRRQRADDLVHELRRPLTSVRGCLEAAEAGLITPDPAFLKSLHEETVLLERLVTDVTDLGEPEVRLTDHDLTSLASEVVALYRAVHVRVVLDAPAPVAVRADPARLRQALGNVVANAVRHTAAGGTVTVAVRQHADEVAVTVADTGSGIPAEHLPHVFDRFHRAADSPGSGLGLAITRQLVAAQRGHVEITSTPGTGTTVTIRLPRRS